MFPPLKDFQKEIDMIYYPELDDSGWIVYFAFLLDTTFKWNKVVTVRIQVVCLIFAVIVLVLSFFSTYAFQAGLVELLYDRFGLTLFISVVYLLLTIALNIWTLTSRWDKPLQFVWPTGLLALFVTQRLMAVIFYYLYKRSMLRIADPRFYEDFDWVQFQRSQMH